MTHRFASRALSSPRRPLFLAGIFVLFQAALAFALLKGRPPLGDEPFHYREIRSILDGTPSAHMLPMPLGYHTVMAFLARLFRASSLDAIRLYSLIASLASVAVFFGCARAVDPRPSLPRTLGYFSLPILFPLFPLVFTDPFALFLILLALWGCLRKRHFWAGLAGASSILVRQANAVWIVFLLLLVWLDGPEPPWSRERILARLRASATYLLALAVFARFVYQNHGFVVATSPDAYNQRLTGKLPIHTGGLFVMILTVWILYLPVVLARTRRIPAEIARRPWILLVPAAALLLYFLTCRGDHPWNGDMWYLRNRVVWFFQAGAVRRLPLVLPLVWILLFFFVTRRKRREHCLLYPFGVASILPFWLIEPRYFFTPIAFFHLFREPENDSLEWALAGWLLVLAWVVYGGTLTERWFL